MNWKLNFNCVRNLKSKLELIPAIYAIMWGLWLIFPWDTFVSSEIFHLMAEIAPEMAWGIFILLIGLSQILFLFVGKIRLCTLSSLLLMFLFISLSIFAAVGNFKSTAMPSFIVMALASWLSYGELLAVARGKE